MATCPECKKYYPDKCPACKQARQPAAHSSASPGSGPASVPPPRRRPAADPNYQPEPDEYPKPASARKKPPRVAMSMSGWAFFYTFLGILMCILAVLCLVFVYFKGFFVLLIGSIPVFCCGKLFKCITEILKNQVEILNLLDGEK